MKSISSFIILLIISGYSFSQVAYHDAIKIKDMGYDVDPKGKIILQVDKNSISEFNNIMKYYMPSSIIKDAPNDSVLFTLIIKQLNENNPFICLGTTGKTFSFLEESKRNKSFSLPTIAASASSLDVTSLSDGLARFLVERTKQELNIVFFEDFEKFLERNEEVSILFPKTSKILSTAKDKLYNYQVYLPILREAFEQDLKGMLDSVYKLINCNNCIGTKLQPAEREYLSIALLLFIDIKQGMHPGDVLNDIAKKIPTITSDQDLISSIYFANLISQSLKSDNKTSYWISPKEAEMFKQPDFARIYIGLLYQQLTTSEDKSALAIQSYLSQNKERIDKIVEKINAVINSATEADKAISKIIDGGKGEVNDYLLAAQKSLNLVGSLSNFYHKNDNVEFGLQHLTNLLSDLQVKSYNSAIFEAYLLLQRFTNLSDEKLDEFIKYGTFIATVSLSKDSKEVQSAIEAVALPSGSYRVKRESAFNVSLNAYCGAFVGYEKIKGVDKGNAQVNFKFKDWNSYGVTAPVGIGLNFGKIKPRCLKNSQSLSLFLSAIDIGALAAYRFANDSASVVPKVELKDIISPGVFLTWGLGKTPFALSFSYQLGPILRKVSPSANTFADNKYTRFGVSLTVDIPIVNLYTKPKWGKK